MSNQPAEQSQPSKPSEPPETSETTHRGFLGRVWRPDPKPKGFAAGKVIPEASASIVSRLLFSWLDPLLAVGFSRPLEVDDLWDLDQVRTSSVVAEQLERNFYSRCPPEKRPIHLREQTDIFTPTTEVDKEKEKIDEDHDHGHGHDIEANGIRRTTTTATNSKKAKVYDESFVFALEKTFRRKFWISGFMQLFGDALATTSPLVTRELLRFLTAAYYHARFPDQFPTGPGIGRGIALAFGLFLMQQGASFCHNHAMANSMTIGLLIRSTVIGQIFRKALRLSGRSRVIHSSGKITTMMSTDTTRLDLVLGFIHNLWVSPLMIILALGLLIANMGYSALVAVGILLLAFPIQGILVRILMGARKEGLKITDSRVRLLQEIVHGIRLIKVYAWEKLYGRKVEDLRRAELNKVRTAAILRALLMTLVSFIPILAAILSFVTYSLTGHALDPAIIFSSLQLINILRMPLLLLPFVVSLASDAWISLGRVGTFLIAEELPPPYPVDPSSKFAIDCQGDFTWEVSDPSKTEGGGKGKGTGAAGPGGKKDDKKAGKAKKTKDDKAKGKDKKEAKAANKGKEPESKQKSENGQNGQNGGPSEDPSPSGTATAHTDKDENEDEDAKDGDKDGTIDPNVFHLNGLKIQVPRGQFVALVGRIGSGKSSCLNALIGEMRKTRGSVTFSGDIAYAPQSAWLANATVQDNILFGNDYDEERFREVVKAASLEPDFEMLPQGAQTEIGEKGINLSGGQKARVSLARVAYSKAEVVLLDDVLSAVDAHVGKSILENCLLSGPLSTRTRVLATHALSALPHVDYIYVLDKGEIVEQGTYDDLLESGPLFSRLIADYGGTQTPKEEPEKAKDKKEKEKGDEAPAAAKPLMQDEDRNTGQIKWGVYGTYISAGGGLFWALVIVLGLLAEQGAQIVTTLILGWWTSDEIAGFKSGQYMGLYAGIGVAQAIIAFFSVFIFALCGVRAGLILFRGALNALLRSPVSFYDTTPVGRVLNRLSRDVESLDNLLPNALSQLMRQLASVIGAIGLVIYTFPYLGISIPFLAVIYYIASAFYRRTSIETKRLDSVLRSNLYASLGETLTGLSTVRAWRIQGRFLGVVDHAIDNQNRAYILTVIAQRWLGIRLDFLANLLVLGIGLFAVGLRKSTNPSKTGVVLSYTLAITQTLSQMVAQMARSEQEMNAVERLNHYSQLPSEAARNTPNDPDSSWPKNGQITFSNVEMAYRPRLPLVLQDVSFKINAKEKIGVVGRTGAGKSSLLQALFRLVEVSGGRIEIDGVNTREIGLDVLRERLAVIPQDALLFKGTVRQNIDPVGTRTDAELISALQRAWLLPRGGQGETDIEPIIVEVAAGEKEGGRANLATRFDLEAPVSEEGSNFSAGERQLLALCRALVKESKIIVMDEATSNVDVETDAKIQRTIQTEFADCTLLCIAHRLNTIVYYDRILVLDGGKVAEYDTPLALYDKEDSIFRSLAREASLTRADIERIRNVVQIGKVAETA